MSDLRTAAQQALEALEDLGMKHCEITGEVLHKEAYAALRAALAQQEQEPVAWMRPDETLCVVREVAEAEGYPPVYTHPPRREWRSLSEEEREAAIKWAIDLDNTQFSRTVARAIEAKLKEKNA